MVVFVPIYIATSIIIMFVFKQYSDTQTRLPLEKYYNLKVKNFPDFSN